MRTSLLLIVTIALLGCSSSRHQTRHEPDQTAERHEHGRHHATQPHADKAYAHYGSHQHRFENAEEWAAIFESPERDAWQRPDEVIAALDIPHGGRVADIGAATGYFPVRIARARPDVIVYGIDLEPDMVRYLAERAQKEGLTNLQAVQATESDPKIPEPVDLVMLVNTYHHVEGREAYFRAVAEKLREGGRLAVVDFRPGSQKGPRHKLPREQVIDELAAAGYRLATEHTFLPEQYFLVFERAE